MSKTLHFTLHLPLEDIPEKEIHGHISCALTEAARDIRVIKKNDPAAIGYFQNIKDDAGEVVGSFAVKNADGSVWRMGEEEKYIPREDRATGGGRYRG